MWPRIVNMIIGFWLMVAPAIFVFEKQISDNERIIGPLVFSISCIAISESVRNFRYANSLCGLWLMAAPWILNYSDTTAILNDMICGLLIILFSLIKGHLKYSFGGGWHSLIQANPSHLQEAERHIGNSIRNNN